MVWKNARHRKASKLGIQPNEARDLRPSLRIEFLKRDLTDNAVSSVPPSVHLWSDPSPKKQHEQRHHQSTHRHAQFLQDHLLNRALCGVRDRHIVLTEDVKAARDIGT